MSKKLIIFAILLNVISSIQAQTRSRARELGIAPSILTPGYFNAITDVKGVAVGQKTLVIGDSIRTGVTVIIPHQGNLFQEKVPASIFVGNGLKIK